MYKATLRRRLILAALAIAVVALAAWGVIALASSDPDESSPSEPTATGTDEGEAQASTDEPLVIDTSFVVQTIDPQRMFEPTSQIAVKALYDTLLTFEGENADPQPWLATEWEVSDDAKTFTFHLRDDVTFSDGTPLTSADVVFSFQRLINLKGSPSFLLENVEVSAPNPYTVVLESSVPNPALIRIVQNPSLGIVNSEVVQANGGTDAPGADQADEAEQFLLSESAGSGPYVLESYSNTTEIVLAANPEFWGPKPYFENVVIRNMPAATQLLNVQRGTNEVALDLSAQQAETLRGNDDLTVVTTASPNLFNIDINMDPEISEVASNPNIQKAIRYALDYDGFVELSGSGATQSPGMVPSHFLGHLPAEDAIEQDLELARAEVAASGIDNPKITLTYPAELNVNGISFATLAQKTKSDLAEVGIEIELLGKPVNAFLETYGAGRHAMSQSYWAPDYPDPNDYLVFLPGGLTALRVNWEEGMDSELEELADVARSTVDDAEREEVFHEIGRLMNERAPFYPLFQPAQAVVSTANLTNVVFGVLWPLDVRAVGVR